MLDHLDRLPGPAARRARDGVRTERGPAAGPVPGRAGDADAVRRGRRAATAGLHRRRRAVARPGLGADPRLRRPPPARRADRDRRARPARAAATTSSPSCPSWSLHGLADSDARALLLDNMHGPLDAAVLRPDRGREPRQPAWRCSSCRAPGTRRSSPAGSGFPAASRSPARSSRATPSACSSCRPTPGCSCSPRPPSRSAISVLLHRAADTPRSRHARRPARPSTPGCSGSALASSSPTRSSGRPPTARRRPRTATASTSRLAEATDPDDRPRSAGLASRRAAHRGPERGGRRRARAVGRPGAGSWRQSRRRRRSCSAPVDADRRSVRGAASGRWPRRRPACRPVRSTPRSAVLATAEAGPLDGFQRARVDLVRAQVAFASGFGSDAPPLLLTAATRPRAVRPRSRTRDLPGGVGCGRDGRSARRPQRVLLEICRAVQALPPPSGPPRPLDLLLDGLARR